MHTLRELMSKILRLETMLSGEHGGVIGEAIRACNRRIDNQRATMDDFYARIRTQDWFHDLSDQEEEEEIRAMVRDTDVENQPGAENRSSGRRRTRGHAPQRRFQRTMPRPPPPPTQDTLGTTTIPIEMIQQAVQRLFDACAQCANRVAQTDDRLEQFKAIVRRDALELALTVQRTDKDMQLQKQNVAHISTTLFEDVQERVKSLEERLRSVIDHEDHVSQTIDKNTHSQVALICALIDEQADIRKLVEEIANRLEPLQGMSSAEQSEISANALLLEISPLKTKVHRLTE